MQVIFTVTIGRSGSSFLASAFSRFGKDCMAEHEPPNLLFHRLHQYRFFNQLGWFSPDRQYTKLGREWQRRTIATHEQMGRGRALEWFDQGEHDKIAELIAKRTARIRGFERRGYRHYVEASQYFIQSFAEATAQVMPDFGLIKLTRDPLECARSLANREKDIFANKLPPDRPSNLFRIGDWQGFSRFQLYCWHWIECEARFFDLVARHNISRTFEIWTHELQDPDKLAEMFDCFGIAHRPFDDLAPVNTNRKPTKVSDDDIREFAEVVALVPDDLADRIPTLAAYRQSADYSAPSAAGSR